MDHPWWKILIVDGIYNGDDGLGLAQEYRIFMIMMTVGDEARQMEIKILRVEYEASPI